MRAPVHRLRRIVIKPKFRLYQDWRSRWQRLLAGEDFAEPPHKGRIDFSGGGIAGGHDERIPGRLR